MSIILHQGQEDMDMKKENNAMERVSKFIVDKRKAVYIVFALALFFSIISIPKVQVNNDITSYLPLDTETRPGGWTSWKRNCDL